jgi:hypothetical protein
MIRQLVSQALPPLVNSVLMPRKPLLAKMLHFDNSTKWMQLNNKSRVHPRARRDHLNEVLEARTPSNEYDERTRTQGQESPTQLTGQVSMLQDHSQHYDLAPTHNNDWLFENYIYDGGTLVPPR